MPIYSYYSQKCQHCQLCVTSGICIACFSGCWGVSVPFTETPFTENPPLDIDPGERPPWTETILGATHRDPPPPPGATQSPLPLCRDPTEGTWDQAARYEATSYRDPPPRLRAVIMKSGTDVNRILCE